MKKRGRIFNSFKEADAVDALARAFMTPPEMRLIALIQGECSTGDY